MIEAERGREGGVGEGCLREPEGACPRRGSGDLMGESEFRVCLERWLGSPQLGGVCAGLQARYGFEQKPERGAQERGAGACVCGCSKARRGSVCSGEGSGAGAPCRRVNSRDWARRAQGVISTSG